MKQNITTPLREDFLENLNNSLFYMSEDKYSITEKETLKLNNNLKKIIKKIKIPFVLKS